MTTKQLLQEGKDNISKALDKLNLDINKIIPNGCDDCEELRLIIKPDRPTEYYCPHDKCIKNISYFDDIQEGEEPAGHPDEDYNNDYDTSMENHLRQIGEKEL